MIFPWKNVLFCNGFSHCHVWWPDRGYIWYGYFPTYWYPHSIAGWWFRCFLHMLGMSSSQLTHIFQRGRAQPPTRLLLTIINHILTMIINHHHDHYPSSLTVYQPLPGRSTTNQIGGFPRPGSPVPRSGIGGEEHDHDPGGWSSNDRQNRPGKLWRKSQEGEIPSGKPTYIYISIQWLGGS